MIISQFNPRHHQYPPIPRLPIIITYQTTLARRTLSLHQPGHAKPHMRRGVKRSGVEDGDAVPAGLDLDGEVALETVRGGTVVEDGFEGGVFEGGAVDVAGYPVVVEYWGTLCPYPSSVSASASHRTACMHGEGHTISSWYI